MREDGSYTKEEFLDRRAAIDNELLATKIALSEARIDQFDMEGAVTYAVSCIADLGRLWLDLPPELRPKFQKVVFPKGISYGRENGFGTPELGYIYGLNRVATAEKSTVVDSGEIDWNLLLAELQEWSRLRFLLKAANDNLPDAMSSAFVIAPAA